MNGKTLFLAWQDKRPDVRAWYPVGRLDVARSEAPFRFQYVQGAERARRESGFEAMLDFPDLHRTYESAELFPLFKNRVLTPGRRDFHDYLRRLDLSDDVDPIDMLAVDGGFRATDSFEVFPKIERQADGAFRCRFFLHGSRHVSESAQKRIDNLRAGEKLYTAIELTNPATKVALQIQTEDYQMIGWAPRYLVSDLVKAMATASGEYAAKVVQLNPVPAPSKQRLLVELSGQWPDYEPMSKGDFAPLQG